MNQIQDHQDRRASIHRVLHSLWTDPSSATDSGLAGSVHADARFHVAYPIGDLTGPSGLLNDWVTPIQRAIPNVMRRPEIAIGGTSRTGSGWWISYLGHYVGRFDEPLFGIPPSGQLVFLRCGEFYRVVDGRIAEAFILPDLLDLMRQTGRMPVRQALGPEILFPGPASHDGVLPDAPDRTEASADLVEAMLSDLHEFDPATFDSDNQAGEKGYWHRDMLWYGPAGIGSNFSYQGFLDDHRIPFLTAFPDRIGGNHFARFGDGDYVASGGWPSMTMTHQGPYLDVEPTGKPLSLRVMDFWRVADGKIMENWVLLDFLELAQQMGRDLIAEVGG